MLTRLGHRPFVGGDHQQRKVNATGSGEHVLDESLVTGDIDDAHLPPGWEGEPGESEVDREAALLLLTQAVRVNPGERADEGALAVIDVPGGPDDVHGSSLQALPGSALGYTGRVSYEWRNWLDLAAGHLENARLALENGGYYVTALLGHQAAEQALKGLWLVVADGLPPRTHNLVELSTRLEAPARVIDAAARLSPHFVASRYPDVAQGNPMANYTKQVAADLLKDAKEVVDWCSSRLPS